MTPYSDVVLGGLAARSTLCRTTESLMRRSFGAWTTPLRSRDSTASRQLSHHCYPPLVALKSLNNIFYLYNSLYFYNSYPPSSGRASKAGTSRASSETLPSSSLRRAEPLRRRVFEGDKAPHAGGAGDPAAGEQLEPDGGSGRDAGVEQADGPRAVLLRRAHHEHLPQHRPHNSHARRRPRAIPLLPAS